MQILDKINKENISDAFALSMTKFLDLLLIPFLQKDMVIEQLYLKQSLVFLEWLQECGCILKA